MTVTKITSAFMVGSLLLASYSVSAEAGNDNEWEFSLAPLFLWGMGINGTSTVGPSTANLELEFKDLFENLEAVFTVHFEAQKGDLSLFAEYQYSSVDPEAELPTGETVGISFKNTLAELGVAYRVSESISTDWEVLGGIRYTKQELGVGGLPSPPLPVDSINVDEDWVDGFVGGRVKTRFAENWSFIGRGDIGAGGSDLVWNLVGMFDYRFKNWGSVFFGYKILDYDYDNDKSGADRYAYDASQQGPLAGLNFYW